jgi:hypothetical protein
MGIERREDEGVEILADDRAAGGKVVGGRSHRRADDQAVAPVGGREFTVHVEPDLDHRKRWSGEDGDVVHPQFPAHRRAATEHLALEEHVIDETESPGFDVGDRRVDLFPRVVCKEAERAEVDPEHGHLVVGHPPRGVEDRAVPAEHDHEVGARKHGCVVGHGRPVRRIAPWHLGSPHAVSAARQPGRQPGRLRGDRLQGGRSDDGDAEVGGCGPVGAQPTGRWHRGLRGKVSGSPSGQR